MVCVVCMLMVLRQLDFKSMVVAQFTGIGLQKDDNAFILYDPGTGRYNGKDSVTEPTELPLYINQKAVFKPAYENFHVKASNDAVIQAVSTFAIGFAAQFLSESGGEQSILTLTQTSVLKLYFLLVLERSI